MELASIISVVSALAALSLVIVGIYGMNLQHGKRFSYATKIENSSEKVIKILFRNDTPHKRVIDRICVYCHGTEIDLISYKKLKKKIIPKNGELEIKINKDDLMELRDYALNCIKTADLSYLTIRHRIRKGYDELENNFSFKLLIRSSGQIYVTWKWITTESIRKIYNEKMDKEENNYGEYDDKELLKIAKKKIFKESHPEIRPLREFGTFKRRRIDPTDEDGYILDIGGTIALLFSMGSFVFSDHVLQFALLTIAFLTTVILMFHRASTGKVKRGDKLMAKVLPYLYASFLIYYFSHEFYFSFIFGLILSSPISILFNVGLDWFSGRARSQIFHWVR